MPLKLTLFDADDLKGLEDMMMRAMVRAMRVAKREGLIEGYTPPEPEIVVQPPEPTEEVAAFGAMMAGGNATPEDDEDEADERRRRRSLTEVCRKVFHAPQGFIHEDQAQEMLREKMSPDSARIMLRKWVFDRRIDAVILCGNGVRPTHGLPGRLMVNHEQLMSRRIGVRGRARNQPPQKNGYVFNPQA